MEASGEMGLAWHHHPPRGWGHFLEAVSALRQEGWELCQQVAGGCDAYRLTGVNKEKPKTGVAPGGLNPSQRSQCRYFN